MCGRQGAFYLSVLVEGEEYQSCRLQLGETEWPYQRPLPTLRGVVPPDGAARLGIFVKQTVHGRVARSGGSSSSSKDVGGSQWR